MQTSKIPTLNLNPALEEGRYGKQRQDFRRGIRIFEIAGYPVVRQNSICNEFYSFALKPVRPYNRKS